MNEAAREKAWLAWWELVVGDDEPGEDTHDPHFNFMGGWDAARTFSAEDVERATDALNDICVPGNTATIRELARAALAAIGTVEEVE